MQLLLDSTNDTPATATASVADDGVGCWLKMERKN